MTEDGRGRLWHSRLACQPMGHLQLPRPLAACHRMELSAETRWKPAPATSRNRHGCSGARWQLPAPLEQLLATNREPDFPFWEQGVASSSRSR
jgi:hypothetical protein